MVTLLGKAISRSARCLWALEEVGVVYEHKPLNYSTGDAKTAEFRAINPGAKIPVLVDGDVTLFESLAINLYVAQAYGKGGLWPDDAAGQALCLQWTLFSATEVEPPGATRLVQFIFKAPEDREQDVIDAAGEKAKPSLDTLEATLQCRAYLAGDTFTVGDLNAACSIEYLTRTGFDLSPWPKTKDWITRCLDRRAYHAVAAIKAKEAA